MFIAICMLIMWKGSAKKDQWFETKSLLQNLQKYGFSSLDGNEDSKLLNNPKAGVKWDDRKIIQSEVKRKKNCDNLGISGNYSNILLE